MNHITKLLFAFAGCMLLLFVLLSFSAYFTILFSNYICKLNYRIDTVSLMCTLQKNGCFSFLYNFISSFNCNYIRNFINIQFFPWLWGSFLNDVTHFFTHFRNVRHHLLKDFKVLLLLDPFSFRMLIFLLCPIYFVVLRLSSHMTKISFYCLL
jgi:hypothetical protein